MIAYCRERRAVVTGVGIVSPIGSSKDVFWASLQAGRSGVSTTCPEDPNAGRCIGSVNDFHGRIEDFRVGDDDIRKAIRKALKLMNRETQMAVAAAQQAIADSGLPTAEVASDRIGVCFGADVVSVMPEDFIAAVQSCTNEDHSFDFSRWGTEGIQHIAPLWMLKCLPNMPACQIAILNNFCGPNNSITERDVSANLAVAEARNLVVDDDADVVIAGAAGTTIYPLNMIHMLSETEVSPGGADPTKVCRPFDRHRNGTVVGEGAAAIVLEEMSAAARRGAPIYGEVLGYGSSCVTGRSGDGHCSVALANAIDAALHRHWISPRDVGHVHAHGLSTRRSDVDEARGIRVMFDFHADRLPVVAAKSYLGNAGAGSGAMELVASLLALRHGRLFPVLNYETPDRECPVAAVTSADVEAGKSFLNLSMVPDGHASCLFVGALE